MSKSNFDFFFNLVNFRFIIVVDTSIYQNDLKEF